MNMIEFDEMSPVTERASHMRNKQTNFAFCFTCMHSIVAQMKSTTNNRRIKKKKRRA